MNETLKALERMTFVVEVLRNTETGELVVLVNGADTRMN